MTKRTAEIVTRSQHSRKSYGSSFGGPDRYLAVVVRPHGSAPVGAHPLSRANAKRFGWEIHYVGEYYYDHTGPRSIYARHLAAARAFIAQVGR